MNKPLIFLTAIVVIAAATAFAALTPPFAPNVPSNIAPDSTAVVIDKTAPNGLPRTFGTNTIGLLTNAIFPVRSGQLMGFNMQASLSGIPTNGNFYALYDRSIKSPQPAAFSSSFAVQIAVPRPFTTNDYSLQWQVNPTNFEGFMYGRLTGFSNQWQGASTTWIVVTASNITATVKGSP